MPARVTNLRHLQVNGVWFTDVVGIQEPSLIVEAVKCESEMKYWYVVFPTLQKNGKNLYVEILNSKFYESKVYKIKEFMYLQHIPHNGSKTLYV